MGPGLPVMNVNAIIKASISMAKRRVGALIVLQRNSLLDNYVSTGDLLDARTTSRLLEAIFNKNSPLHDGAVIIHDERIRAASCILPVSDNFELPEYLGLRHRAGVGLTEQSDALVIIISEQTGTISLSESGMIRPVEIKELHKILENEFIPHKKK
jgi:DNA integrity scanning protein DisA with diadenylate cyclase activity